VPLLLSPPLFQFQFHSLKRIPHFWRQQRWSTSCIKWVRFFCRTTCILSLSLPPSHSHSPWQQKQLSLSFRAHQIGPIRQK
jgi:hypothetical protein